MTSTIAEAVVFFSGSLAISILFKTTILLALGLLAASLAGRSRAALRHVLLAAAFGALVILPVIAVSDLAFPIEIPAAVDSSLPSTGAAADWSSDASPSAIRDGARSERAPRPSWSPSWIWLGGTVMFLWPLAVNLWWLRGLRRNGLPWPEWQRRAASLAAEAGIRRPIEVLLHEGTQTPLTCGFLRAAIILPCDARAWSDVELRCAVIHELEHVRRGDWATQLMARAICACYWFHPLVWVAWRRLCLEAERACDDAVIRREEHTDYAEQLVSLARRMPVAHPHGALGMANRSDLSRRISAVLDTTQRRGRAGRVAAAGVLLAAGLVSVAIAPIQAVAQPSRPSALDRALYEAAESAEISDIERLLNAGANVNSAISGDGSPLIGAARRGHLDAVRLLLDRGADPNMAVRGDGNPLIMAAREGHAAVVTLLLDRGARIDEVAPDDENALIQASGRGQLNVVQLLVSRGANVNARVWADDEERSPLRMARKGGHQKVVDYLASHGARE